MGTIINLRGFAPLLPRVITGIRKPVLLQLRCQYQGSLSRAAAASAVPSTRAYARSSYDELGSTTEGGERSASNTTASPGSSQKPSRDHEPGTSSSSSSNTPIIPSNKAHPTLNDGKQTPNVDESGEPLPDADVPEDVKRHNREMDQRYDRAYNRIADEKGTVEKGFWKEDRDRRN
ncbi:hypothetical protein Egran_02039 [Elaphomyces granulatus]|uniref:Uncharacterized protein n=1 Tax=Elaphomyces granulatus TaxID=519963 RepID=A0A232M1C0_9EURO|nr:hypothetical protein Egran_02039 [Elaphomyces granulatus]